MAWDSDGVMLALAPFRLARAAAFAVVCLGLGVAAHLFGGGSVSMPGAAGALAICFAVALPLTGRERTFAVILPVLVALQAVQHLIFALAEAAPVTAAREAAVAAALAESHALPHTGLVPSLGMVMVHGWAATLTALWLARGETALWSLLRRLAVRLLVFAVALDPVETPAAVPAAPEPKAPRSALPRHVVTRRGPPAVLHVL